MRLVEELRKLLTRDATGCSDMGSFSLYLWRYPTSFRARQFLISNGQKNLGRGDAMGNCRDIGPPS